MVSGGYDVYGLDYHILGAYYWKFLPGVEF